MIFKHERMTKIATGTKTQTINICTVDNQHGEYDYILRIFEKNNFITYNILKSINSSSIDEFIGYLEKNHSAKIEKSPNQLEKTFSIMDNQIDISTFYKKDEVFSWKEKAIKIVETSINQLY